MVIGARLCIHVCMCVHESVAQLRSFMIGVVYA
jgi:hypothetical protein